MCWICCSMQAEECIRSPFQLSQLRGMLTDEKYSPISLVGGRDNRTCMCIKHLQTAAIFPQKTSFIRPYVGRQLLTVQKWHKGIIHDPLISNYQFQLELKQRVQCFISLNDNNFLRFERLQKQAATGSTDNMLHNLLNWPRKSNGSS